MDRPEHIGKYDLVETLGAGGMATVYRGRDPDLMREVAVKVLHSHLCCREESRMRFRREARAVARLKHPAVLEVYEAGEDEGRPYIVSELVRGGSLDAWASARRPIPTEISAAIGLHVAEGLQAAHQAGIIHRDLKPGNVLMGAGGKVKIADFGIAHVIDIEHLTSTGQILGSPAFMSPEHLEGTRLDARADVFSFGTLLYWLATGELPFVGPNAHAVLRKVLEAEYPDPARVRPDIGEHIAGVIRTCLRKKAEERYASMADVGSALRSVLAVCGVGAADALLEAFEREPDPERAAIVARRETTLLERCRRLRGTRDGDAEVRRLCGWILARDPEHREALDLVEETMGRRSRARLALGAAVLAAVAVAVVALWLVLGRGPSPPPAAGLADAVVARARDASAGIPGRRPDGAAVVAVTPAADGLRPRDAEATAPGDAPEPRPDAAPAVPEAAADVSGEAPEASEVPAGEAVRPGEAAGPAGETEAHAVPPRALRTVVFRAPAPCNNVEIWVDGESLGVWGPSPGVMETRLAPGEHRFEYRPRTVNCYPAEWTEAIPAGTEAYALAHRLALRPATLIVDTAGVEATVDVLERRAGRANEPIEIPFEAHEGVEITLRVAITFAGRPPLRRDVKVRAGDSVTITVPPPASGAAGADGGETDRGPE